MTSTTRLSFLLAAALATTSLTLAACSGDPDVIRVSKKRTPGAQPEDGDGDDDDGGGPPASRDGGASSSSSGDGGSGGDGGVVPASTGSKGSGGPTGRSTLTSKGGLKFILDVPTAPSTKPRGLLVLLHGSTASNYTQFVDMMSAVAAKYDLIRASVLAPNGQGWNEGGNAAQAQAADLLHRLVQEDLLAKYDVETTRVFFSGQSSGGGFLSTHFLPLHAKDYRGGAFMQCGAAPPASAFAPDAATKANLKLHFEITTGDTIWPTSFKNAVTAYTAAGMSLTKDDTKPGGHCAFDQQAVILAHIDAMLK